MLIVLNSHGSRITPSIVVFQYYCWSADAASRPGFAEIVETLEKLLLTEMDYIELDRFPEHSYYNLSGLSGEKV